MRSLLYSLLLVATSLPILVYGQGKVYSPLVNIPGNGANGFEEYISFLYGASISVAALLAVVKIIIAGAKYMMSDVITNKGEAIKDIQGAIFGLLLILGAVIILEFINPQLIKRDIKFQTIAPPPTPVSQNSSVTAAQTTDFSTLLNGCGKRTDFSSDAEIVIGVDLKASPACPDTGAAGGQFSRDCLFKGGTLNTKKADQFILVCGIAKPDSVTNPVVGTAQTNAISTSLQKVFGASNVTTEGTKITVNIDTGCYEKFRTSPTKTAYVSCKSAARTQVELPCTKAGVYGRFDGKNNSTTVTCELPKQVKTVDSFKGYDPKFPSATPETEEEFEAQCKKVGGTYIEDAVTTIIQAPYSPLNDRCVIY